jgi:hypothetical protein
MKSNEIEEMRGSFALLQFALWLSGRNQSGQSQ